MVSKLKTVKDENQRNELVKKLREIEKERNDVPYGIAQDENYRRMVRHWVLSLQREGRAIRTGNEVAKQYADNKVDIVFYAVEKSLDAYKFGLIHNKQLFIRQLKTNNLGVRTIDEGAMDEKSGMNMAEYVAILSGNTELLEKARLEKKVIALESEQKSFVRDKSSSRYKLDNIIGEVTKKQILIESIGKDLEHFKSRVQLNADGSYCNPVQLIGVEGGDPKFIGKHLNYLAKNTHTGTQAEVIGHLYGFDLLIKSEIIVVDGFNTVQNRFYARGEGEYLYHYNNGIIANDHRLASSNFIHALSTIETILEKLQKETTSLKKDIPILQEVVGGKWSKEPQLIALKRELTELDRKIQLTLKPINEGEDIPESEKTEHTQQPKEKTPGISFRLQELVNRSDGHTVIASGERSSIDKPDLNKKGVKM